MQLVQAPSCSRSGRQPHLGAAWRSHRRAGPTPPLGQALGHINSGRCHFDRGRFSSAMVVTALYDRVLAINPRCSTALFALGECHNLRGELRHAKRLWERAVAVDPADPHDCCGSLAFLCDVTLNPADDGSSFYHNCLTANSLLDERSPADPTWRVGRSWWQRIPADGPIIMRCFGEYHEDCGRRAHAELAFEE